MMRLYKFNDTILLSYKGSHEKGQETGDALSNANKYRPCAVLH